ncbi:hypothetical protein BT63DRAFT_286621 [Microthyrium microscopicum]|uniref:SP-RING-type domain-containing protein n=1 Tax=Microthyrium microscopicum TaxID=703497 RepID=A0A6A6UA61_9PEZI|nr:hypothetical protein BT63DRAFT_286621 [Microthyrium microscopicum]
MGPPHVSRRTSAQAASPPQQQGSSFAILPSSTFSHPNHQLQAQTYRQAAPRRQNIHMPQQRVNAAVQQIRTISPHQIANSASHPFAMTYPVASSAALNYNHVDAFASVQQVSASPTFSPTSGYIPALGTGPQSMTELYRNHTIIFINTQPQEHTPYHISRVTPAWNALNQRLSAIPTNDGPIRDRLRVVHTALQDHDHLFLLMQQLYSLKILMRPIPQSVDVMSGFRAMYGVMGDTRLPQAAEEAFAEFPIPLSEFAMVYPDMYAFWTKQIALMFSKIQELQPFHQLCIKRHYPPTVKELVINAAICSTTMMRLSFRYILIQLWSRPPHLRDGFIIEAFRIFDANLSAIKSANTFEEFYAVEEGPFIYHLQLLNQQFAEKSREHAQQLQAQQQVSQQQAVQAQHHAHMLAQQSAHLAAQQHQTHIVAQRQAEMDAQRDADLFAQAGAQAEAEMTANAEALAQAQNLAESAIQEQDEWQRFLHNPQSDLVAQEPAQEPAQQQQAHEQVQYQTGDQFQQQARQQADELQTQREEALQQAQRRQQTEQQAQQQTQQPLPIQTQIPAQTNLLVATTTPLPDDVPTAAPIDTDNNNTNLLQGIFGDEQSGTRASPIDQLSLALTLGSPNGAFAVQPVPDSNVFQVDQIMAGVPPVENLAQNTGSMQRNQRVEPIFDLSAPIIPPQGLLSAQPREPNAMTHALHQAHLAEPILRVIDNNGLPTEEPYCQYVNGGMAHALNPDIVLAKFHHELSDQDFSNKASESHPVHTVGTIFKFRDLHPTSLQYRVRLVKSTVHSESIDPYNQVATGFPTWVHLMLNDEHLEPRLKLHHGKNLPIDITDKLQNGINTLTVSINLAKGDQQSKNWHVLFERVGLTNATRIYQYASTHNAISKETVLKEFARTLSSNDDDDDIVIISDSRDICVLDPLSQSLVTDKPARGKDCKHAQCFSLEYFLESRLKVKMPKDANDTWKLPKTNLTQVDVWKCPICNGDVRPLNLCIDQWMLGVRQELIAMGREDVSEITVKADGTWKPKEFKAKGKDDERNGRASAGTKSATPKPKQEETLVSRLTLPDDDIIIID